MNRWTLSLRSLRFYWRTHVCVLLGLAIAAGVLIGALIVGDSVRYSLDRIAFARTGKATYVWLGHDRFFRDAIVVDGAPVLMLDGIVALPTGTRRANGVQVMGVDERFWQLSPAGSADAGVWMNEHLARRLDVKALDTVVVRVARPTALPIDAPLSSDDDARVALRFVIAGTVDDEHYGRFGLSANQVPPDSIFLPLAMLQSRLELEGRVNLALFKDVPTLKERWTLADSQLELKNGELRSPRVFLDPPVVEAALAVSDAAFPVLTYFANRLQIGERSIPYSTVAAVPFDGKSPWASMVKRAPDPDEIVLNEWAASDLNAAIGDSVTVAYYTMGPLRALIETTAVFRVSEVVPLSGAADDPTLMPDYPGLSEAENCGDWDPGFSIDLDAIREQDEAYWDDHRGTPKAFIALESGRRLWANRFGDATAVRFADSTGVEEAMAAVLDPFALGHQVLPFREQAERASREAMSFSELFISFSFFLIAAALLLSAMLFVFGVEQRTQEIGTLRAVGYSQRTVEQLFQWEGLVLAVWGALLGVGLGIGYTRLLLHGLDSFWRSAIGETNLWYHANPSSVVAGVVVSVVIGWAMVAWMTRRLVRKPADQLLRGADDGGGAGVIRPAHWAGWVAAACMVAAGWIGWHTLSSDSANPANSFFSAGGLLLVGGLFLSHRWLTGLACSSAKRFSRRKLNLRNLTRRRGRSLATIALLACGSFMVIATGAHRQDASRGAGLPSSGTGGFEFVGQLTQPLARDLNQASEQEFYGIDADVMAGVTVVPVRIRAGDDASCLNLNRAQRPRLAGVSPEALAGRFTFAAMKGEAADPWQLLNQRLDDGAVPAVADNNSMLWAMGKKIGDTVLYTDERGRELPVRLVGGLANSMLQGSVLIADARFVESFPSESGYRTLWIDVEGEPKTVADELSFALQDAGLELQSAVERLNEFNAVQNTYLSIFQVLGGMGLLLGSVGMGIVLLRNILERRAELALLRGLGFTRRGLARLLIGEHTLLLVLGLGWGLVAAGLAVAPSLMTPGSDFPVLYLGGLTAAVFVNGLVWVLGAVWLASHGKLLPALRAE